jgi:hypothetical protein
MVGRSGVSWRVALWGGAGALLLLPLAAMRVSDQVDWGAEDFAVFGAMLLGACGCWELAARRRGSRASRAGAGLAVVTAFVLVWINLAVGVVGPEDDPVNRVFFGVLGVAVIGAGLARARPGGMARALAATAVAQMLAAGIALAAGGGPAGEVLALNGGFAGLWLASAWLFRRAARAEG